MAVPSGDLTPLAPSTPTAEWGATAQSCVQFGSQPCLLFKVVGCGAGDPSCPGSDAPPCVVVYSKSDPNQPGSTAPYAYDLNAAGNFKLTGQNPVQFFVSPDQHELVWETLADAAPPGTTPFDAHYVNLCTHVEGICPARNVNALGDSVAWRPDGGGFVVAGYGGQLAVASYDPGSCVFPPDATAAAIFQFQYSPQSDRMMWLADAGTLDPSQTAWVANADGSAPQMVATGNLAGARFSPSGTHAIMARVAASSISLTTVDLTATPFVERTLADNYGGTSRGGDRRALFLDHWNSQDQSGDLVLLDLASGARQVFGQAVTEFTAAGDVEAGGTNVAYAVRSRVASDRDGIWLTALPP
jgi:hypothetical protein